MFETKSLRRWFAIGTLFWPPYRVPLPGGEESLGCQVLAMQDVESQCLIGQRIAGHVPAPFTAEEIITFTEDVFARHGPPKNGLVILPSTWRSSDAVHDDEVTRQRIAGARELRMAWAEMCAAERLKIALRIQSLGIELEWNEEAVPGLEELLDC